MKTIIALIAIAFSFHLFATPIKTCSTVLQIPEEDAIPSKFEIFESNGSLTAAVTQKIEGETVSYSEKASVSDHAVQAGLSAETESETLNPAEALVVHAMVLEGLGMKSGVNLSKVRGARVFTIGEFSNMGGTAIVEARDIKGKTLGSYLGGFLVSPCK